MNPCRCRAELVRHGRITSMAQSRVLHVAEIATKRVLRRCMQIEHVVERHQRKPEFLRLRGPRLLVLSLQPCRHLRAALLSPYPRAGPPPTPPRNFVHPTLLP